MINIETTYEIIIQERIFFFDILEYIKESNNDKENDFSKNTIPLYIYENLLDNYLSSKLNHRQINTITSVLSFENLRINNIFSITNTENNIVYITLVQHVYEMIKNIYKQFDNALNDAHYKEYRTLMSEKRAFFENNSLRKTIELDNEIIALKDFLEQVSASLRTSIFALNYQQHELSKNSNSNKIESANIQIKKLKEVKKIRSRYIDPLYIFMDKKSPFIEELKRLSNFLNENKKLLNVYKTLNFYYTSYLLITKEAAVIRKYFNNYIKQSEQELYWSLGSEYMFNQLLSISEKLKDGRKNNYKIWNQQEELLKINPFFNNTNLKDKSPELLKTNPIKDSTFKLYYLTAAESLNKDMHKKYEKAILNEEYEKTKKIKLIEIQKKQDMAELLNSFYIYIDSINIENQEITNLVLFFLNSKNNLEWHLGTFQYLVSKLIKNNKKLKIKTLEKIRMTHMNKTVEYHTFKLIKE